MFLLSDQIDVFHPTQCSLTRIELDGQGNKAEQGRETKSYNTQNQRSVVPKKSGKTGTTKCEDWHCNVTQLQ